MGTGINSKWVSVVIQGQTTEDLLPQCVDLLRQSLPDSEIILSTWNGSNVSGIENIDKIIFSPDPGTFCADEIVGTLNNVNRQIVSTQAGVDAAARPYILKTRTDILIHNAGFLSYFEKYDAIPSNYFRNRLLICNYYTRNPRIFNTCFHPSDWILFGRAEDIRTYYENIPLMTVEDGEWFRHHPKVSTFFTNYVCRFTPEQHMFLSFLRKYNNPECDNYYDHCPRLVAETERAFAECFVVLDYQKQLSITFSKYNPNRYLEKHTTIAHWQWRALYQYYCQKKVGALWVLYQLYGAAWKCVSSIRALGIRILDFLGIKEATKSFLRGLSNFLRDDTQ